jgi:hypothetical protein
MRTVYRPPALVGSPATTAIVAPSIPFTGLHVRLSGVTIVAVVAEADEDIVSATATPSIAVAATAAT